MVGTNRYEEFFRDGYRKVMRKVYERPNSSKPVGKLHVFHRDGQLLFPDLAKKAHTKRI